MKSILTLVFSIALLFNSNLSAQSTGKITGTVVDAQTGETLIGVNVVLESQPTKGTATNLDGKYTISGLAPGTYNIVATYVSFARQTITGVEVGEGETVTLDIALEEETEELDDVIVTAEAILSSEAGLLRQRQKSIAFSDAISAETISNSGAGDAAGVMKKVVGASVVGGKYVYVRGLGDRYSSSHLNGVELPSADPDKKSFQFDIFPSNLLENIVTVKSFTPDKPGNFSGGLVNVNTKDFPEKETFSYSFSTKYNTLATGEEGYLSTTGDKDLLAYDNGMRDIPKTIKEFRQNPDFEVPSSIEARFDEDKAQVLDQYSNAFNNEMAPLLRTMPMSSSSSISYGNQAELFGNALGFTASLTYSRSSKNYTDGQIGRWQLIGNLDDSDGLTNLFNLNDSKGEITVDMGSLFGLSYRLGENHKISSNALITRSATHSGRSISGTWNEEAPDDIYQSSVISYVERTLNSYQLQGKHYFKGLANSTIEWKASYAKNTQEEPDLRFLTYLIQEDSNGEEFLSLSTALFQRPARFFRDLEEDNTNYIVDYSLPFSIFGGNQAKFKTGLYYQTVNRDFNESRFEYTTSARAPKTFTDFRDNINGFFGYTGIVDRDSRDRPIFGNTLRDATNQKNQYNAEKEVTAFYGMLELPLSDSFKIIGGLRQENTDIRTVSADTTLQAGELTNHDLLPSVTTILNLTDQMNLRASYTNTVARPTFRELAPYTTFDFVGDFIFTGNAELKRTLIKNADIRWEYFPNPSEIIAVSAFYKDISNPIERVVRIDVNRAQTVQNVEEASVFGVEFEFRKNLGVLSEALEHFSFSNNFTIVDSRVTIPEEELYNIRLNDPDAKDYRRLDGQSPYLVNLGLEYFNPDNGMTVNTSFNTFGDRLYSVALGASPDVYERGYSTLDIVASKSFQNGLKVKVSGTNLLDPDIKYSQELNGEEFIYQSYRKGISLSLGVSYSF